MPGISFKDLRGGLRRVQITGWGPLSPAGLCSGRAPLDSGGLLPFSGGRRFLVVVRVFQVHGRDGEVNGKWTCQRCQIKTRRAISVAPAGEGFSGSLRKPEPNG